MNINMKFDKILAKLSKTTTDKSAQELYALARREHYMALGSKTNSAATTHELRADAYRKLAKEKEGVI